ncbi:MAG TPA: TIGR04563 family protein [Anaeromyxobacteraceae bacterium]|nr:TIGR04563 family protein [Anaeromyxobacteraceae bacterium]
MAQTTDKRKQSLYFPEDMLQEIEDEANRQDRSLSWIVQQAWRAARDQIAKMPGVDQLGPPRA